MEVRDYTQDLGSEISGLSSLEKAADDEFEKLMLQNERDEQRLRRALQGTANAFRKARTHPNVGITMENLERNDVRNHVLTDPNAHIKHLSPPSSSSGSNRSDPALHITREWGKKSRLARRWLRSTEQPEHSMSTRAVSTPNGIYAGSHQQHENDVIGTDALHYTVQNSPLSHKSSIHGTPCNDRSANLDLTFELNEASMIASTPYIPRNTALDVIRSRELEAMVEADEMTLHQGSSHKVDCARVHRSQSFPAGGAEVHGGARHVKREITTSDISLQRSQMQTKSRPSAGKAQRVADAGRTTSPVTVYTSTEQTSPAQHAESVKAHAQRLRRMDHRRGDSQDLLRRLARASNTPSPARTSIPQPQVAVNRQPTESKLVNINSSEAQEHEDFSNGALKPTKDTSSSEQPLAEVADVDATPMPIEQSLLDPKTPVVMGAWVETPGPRIAQKTIHTAGILSRQSHRVGQDNGDQASRSTVSPRQTGLVDISPEVIRPSLPSSALQALVQESRANSRRESADFGDSTINSLEDLITTRPEDTNTGADEDTLQGLQLSTNTPRSEAERKRQQEVLHLHRMNDRLRAARTSIRDARRGMKRVEDRVEHVDEGEGNRSMFSLRQWGKSLLWQERTKAERQVSNSWWKIWGGLTWFGIFVLALFTWWISEGIACEMYCHHTYAQFSPHAFSVNMDAPQYPFVMPTLVYRTFIKAWWAPISSALYWMGTMVYQSLFGVDGVTSQSIVDGATRVMSSRAGPNVWSVSSQAAELVEELGLDLRMGDDQLLDKHR